MLSMWKPTSLALAFLLVGCSDRSATDLVAPNRTPLSADRMLADRNSHAPKNSVQAITGHAQFVPTVNLNGEQKYEVEAHQKGGESAKGEFQYEGVSGGGFHIHGDIYCFTLAGNTARVAGRVERSTNPNVHAGDFLIWSFIDNDPGPGHQPDFTTELQRVDQSVATAHCATTGVSTGPFYQIQGHLEVRPEAATP